MKINDATDKLAPLAQPMRLRVARELVMGGLVGAWLTPCFAGQP